MIAAAPFADPPIPVPRPMKIGCQVCKGQHYRPKTKPREHLSIVYTPRYKVPYVACTSCCNNPDRINNFEWMYEARFLEQKEQPL